MTAWVHSATSQTYMRRGLNPLLVQQQQLRLLLRQMR